MMGLEYYFADAYSSDQLIFWLRVADFALTMMILGWCFHLSNRLFKYLSRKKK